ncbi:endonuclease/Exonuclease/phosphatase family protein [Hirsutella rhossiliensis]|uniref:Endonuclease/Exonuclease/phosphatase family domain-containing protein n=1 Tax=Hirsutella rhossiliensis TaxID=111463 RepID=A0A9P8MTB7_9HYPO|nr:endonuclease/Exonuclease/phosphatase family domain-containing protein [Hirsutella rhossiliensis]KAH0958827.1 endonuclease/Exonuclease/phosphatase family domain-containing protein [Hirsutella rhossiliensis]
MERDSFTAKRRAARSSPQFHLVLAAALLFCLLLAWRSGSFSLRAQLDRPPQQAANFDFQPDNAAQVVLTPVDKDMAPRSASMPMRIITYNIRYATEKQVADEKPWTIRCPKLCNQVRFITTGHENPFLCLQEALHAQVNDVQAELGPSWAFIGRGREEGEADGEYSPIFYRSDTWKCTRSQTRWLSPTPEVPSRGWDAAFSRIVTMGEFLHNETGTSVVVMNTHFDHVGYRARTESAKLLIKFAKEWGAGDGVTAPPSAVLVAGDFNSPPDEEAYKVMTAPGSGMSDIANLVPKEKHYGNNLTYTSFGEPNEPPLLIDFLFIQEPRTATINTFGVLDNSFDDRLLLSDHRPVVADLDVKI